MAADETVATYCVAWDEPDPVRRAEVLAGVMTDDVVYVDPTVRTVGRAELTDQIARVQGRRPGSRLVVTSSVDVRHDLARFGWKRVLADGSELPESIDVVRFADDGRLAEIIGFFGPLRGEQPLPRVSRSLAAGAGEYWNPLATAEVTAMTAARIHEYGGPAVIRYERAPRPTPGPRRDARPRRGGRVQSVRRYSPVTLSRLGTSRRRQSGPRGRHGGCGGGRRD